LWLAVLTHAPPLRALSSVILISCRTILHITELSISTASSKPACWASWHFWRVMKSITRGKVLMTRTTLNVYDL
jgi:hypothetical protein